MMQTVWVAPKMAHMTTEQLEAIKEWLKLHDIDPCNALGDAAVVIESNGVRHLHVSEFVLDEDGARCVDYAQNEHVTRPRVVQLLAEPPIPTRNDPTDSWWHAPGCEIPGTDTER
jgi:hypothetical protein